MILDGKAAAKLMAAGFKDSGYDVCGFVWNDVPWIGVDGGDWSFAGQRSRLPREVLAKIVEHGGELPGPGEAWTLEKRQPNQLKDWEWVQERFLEDLEAKAAESVMAPTRIYLGKNRLWQDSSTGHVWKMDPDMTAVGAAAKAMDIQPIAGRMRMMGTISVVGLYPVSREETDRKLIEHLEKFRGL